MNRRKHVVCIGASGYGNVGDDIYPQLWRAYFPEVRWSFINSDVHGQKFPNDVDLVLFGGGGIMFNNESAHLEYMRSYVSEAERLEVPFGFLSCDIQVRRAPGCKQDVFEYSSIKPWFEILHKASFVSVRSENTQSLLADEGITSQFVPDLAYLFRPGCAGTDAEICGSVRAASERSEFLVISGARVGGKSEEVLDKVIKLWEERKPYHFCVMNMGGPTCDDETLFLHEKLCDRLDFVPALYNSSVINPLQALALINNAAFVVSGRYHGMVLSRNCNTPFWVPKLMQYKLTVEPPLYSGDPYENILLLRQVLDTR